MRRAFQMCIRDRNGAEQAARVLVDGVGEDLLHRALLHNLASVHDGDGVGDLGNERQVVAHEHLSLIHICLRTPW